MPDVRTALRRTSARHSAARPASGGGGGGSSVLTAADFTYLGAYKINRDPISGYQSVYGNGLALRYESADATNPVHLLSTGYGLPVNNVVYEWRDATPT